MAILQDLTANNPAERKKAVQNMLLAQTPNMVKQGIQFMKDYFDPPGDILTPTQIAKMSHAHKLFIKFIDKTIPQIEPDKSGGSITPELADFLLKFNKFQQLKEVTHDEETHPAPKVFEPKPSAKGNVNSRVHKPIRDVLG
jgi:hypothetical protein